MNKAGTQRIETHRLILRPFRIEDAEDMFENWASDPGRNSICRIGRPQGRRRIEGAGGTPRPLRPKLTACTTFGDLAYFHLVLCLKPPPPSGQSIYRDDCRDSSR